LRPDVVTMDMILPGTSGLVATEQIMAYTPTPILVVSASPATMMPFRSSTPTRWRRMVKESSTTSARSGLPEAAFKLRLPRLWTAAWKTA
jgi:hypothetical protein